MAHFAKFVSLARTPAEIKETTDKMAAPCAPSMDQPIYPYGMCITLDDETLAKLKLESNCEPGDVIHLCCMAKVTDCSKRDTAEGTKSRVELQITDIALENEDAENEAAGMARETRIKGRYKGEAA